MHLKRSRQYVTVSHEEIRVAGFRPAPDSKSGVGDIEMLLVVGERQSVGLCKTIRNCIHHADVANPVNLVIHLGRASESLHAAIAGIREPNGPVSLHNSIVRTVERHPEPVVCYNRILHCLQVDPLNETSLVQRPLLAYHQITIVVKHHSVRSIVIRRAQVCHVSCPQIHLLELEHCAVGND